MAVRILIADDHGVLRAGLRALLNSEAGMQVVGEAADCEAVLSLADSLRPDVVLMDISMPGCGGIEATRRLTEQHPELRILILTVHEDQGLLQAALGAGASGYILKRAVESELINAIQAVARGDLYIYPALIRTLLETTGSVPAPEPVEVNITPREVQVLRLLTGGHTNRQIADQLTLSVRTIETHRANLMEKLGLRSRVELVRYAIEHGHFDVASS